MSSRHRKVLGVSRRDVVRQPSLKSDEDARYTTIWNLLDWPGAVFPTGLIVDPAVDVVDPKFSPLGPEDTYYHHLCAFP